MIKFNKLYFNNLNYVRHIVIIIANMTSYYILLVNKFHIKH